MNVMYVSVAERTFEIGLRKSVGASAQAIQLQFLVESVVVTCVGGVLGMILGICLAYLVSLVAQVAGYDWAFGVPWFALFLGFVFSCLVGIGFGWYPAKQASLLDPIQAMRKE
jgi:putative ABC transport system permease protein